MTVMRTIALIVVNLDIIHLHEKPSLTSADISLIDAGRFSGSSLYRTGL
jgi:hypothetical protein